MPNLLRIFYVSKLSPGCTVSELPKILSVSRRNNQTLGVTGVLCCRGGYFAQILEGEELTVLSLYTRIARDPRHQDCVIISIGTTDQRLFPAWSMGGLGEEVNPFVSADEILQLRTRHAGAETIPLMQRWIKLLETASRA